MTLRTKKLETTSAYERNTERYHGELCARYGRPVHNPKHFVHLIDGGCIILHPDDEELYDEDDPGNCGLYPIGSECAKNLEGWTQE